MVACLAGARIIPPRNPRRAYDKDGREYPPSHDGARRNHGINTLWATWAEDRLGQAAKIDASRFPDDMPVPDVGLRLRCSKCGGRNVQTMAELVGERLAQALSRR